MKRSHVLCLELLMLSLSGCVHYTGEGHDVWSCGHTIVLETAQTGEKALGAPVAMGGASSNEVGNYFELIISPSALGGTHSVHRTETADGRWEIDVDRTDTGNEGRIGFFNGIVSAIAGFLGGLFASGIVAA